MRMNRARLRRLATCAVLLAGTVDDTGRVTFPPDSLVNAVPIPMGVDTCGTITPAPTMLTFAGTTAQFLQTATSDSCGSLRSWAR